MPVPLLCAWRIRNPFPAGPRPPTTSFRTKAIPCWGGTGRLAAPTSRISSVHQVPGRPCSTGSRGVSLLRSAVAASGLQVRPSPRDLRAHDEFGKGGALGGWGAVSRTSSQDTGIWRGQAHKGGSRRPYRRGRFGTRRSFRIGWPACNRSSLAGPRGRSGSEAVPIDHRASAGVCESPASGPVRAVPPRRVFRRST